MNLGLEELPGETVSEMANRERNGEDERGREKGQFQPDRDVGPSEQLTPFGGLMYRRAGRNATALPSN